MLGKRFNFPLRDRAAADDEYCFAPQIEKNGVVRHEITYLSGLPYMTALFSLNGMNLLTWLYNTAENISTSRANYPSKNSFEKCSDFFTFSC
jgi:hypothetical protein